MPERKEIKTRLDLECNMYAGMADELPDFKNYNPDTVLTNGRRKFLISIIFPDGMESFDLKGDCMVFDYS